MKYLCMFLIFNNYSKFFKYLYQTKMSIESEEKEHYLILKNLRFGIRTVFNYMKQHNLLHNLFICFLSSYSDHNYSTNLTLEVNETWSRSFYQMIIKLIISTILKLIFGIFKLSKLKIIKIAKFSNILKKDYELQN